MQTDLSDLFPRDAPSAEHDHSDSVCEGAEASQLQQGMPAEEPGVILFDVSKKETCHPAAGYKQLHRKLRTNFKVQTYVRPLSVHGAGGETAGNSLTLVVDGAHGVQKQPRDQR